MQALDLPSTLIPLAKTWPCPTARQAGKCSQDRWIRLSLVTCSLLLPLVQTAATAGRSPPSPLPTLWNLCWKECFSTMHLLWKQGVSRRMKNKERKHLFPAKAAPHIAWRWVSLRSLSRSLLGASCAHGPRQGAPCKDPALQLVESRDGRKEYLLLRTHQDLSHTLHSVIVAPANYHGLVLAILETERLRLG